MRLWPLLIPHRRLSTRFYVVALAFVIFDLEAMFLFAWAGSLPPPAWCWAPPLPR